MKLQLLLTLPLSLLISSVFGHTSQAACTPQKPTLMIDSEKTMTNVVTGTRNIKLKIINNDSYLCPPSQFILQANLPEGLTQLYPFKPVLIPPGGSAQPLFEVAYSNLESGLYAFSLTLTDVDNVAPAHEPLLGEGSFFVDGGMPTTPQNLVVSSTEVDIVSLSWDSSVDLETDIFFYEIFRDLGTGYGFQRVGVAHYGPYYEDWYASGSPVYYVIAVDRAGNYSAPSNKVQVTVMTKGGGSKKGSTTDAPGGSGNGRGKK